jgi:HD-GYP domain-containing protein (c-di-GMP phosphodiesterase class II)
MLDPLEESFDIPDMPPSIKPVEAIPENEKIFKDYGTEFQEGLMCVLLHDREYALEASEIMHPNMFEARHVNFIGELYWKFFKKYQAFPTMSIFINDIVKQELKGMDDSLRNNVTNFLIKCSKKPEKADAEYLKEKMEKFCRNRNIKNALVEAVSLVKDEKYDAIISLLNKAVAQSSTSSKGHDFHLEREARWLGIERSPVPTGIKLLVK